MAEEEDDTSGDSTDIFSQKFDSYKTFYSDKVKVPDVKAPIFDNISKFESFCLKGPKSKISNDRSSQQGKQSTSRSLVSQDSRKSQIFRKKNAHSDKNVVNRMEKASGPLSALYQYMENKSKVKIYTRSINGIRGHVEAYVVAFDTHWNLALEDCFEVWTRKIARKSPVLGVAGAKLPNESDMSCTVSIKEKSKKIETLERHVPQLLLRGEQIVSIVKIE